MASFLSSLPAVSARPIPTSAFPLRKPLFQTPPTLHFKNHRFAVSCSYAEAGVNADSSSNTIDVVADVRSERIVVLGGNGFVGSAICKAAVSRGIEVISLSRSGRPTYSDAWVDQVTWISGDVFYVNWDEVLVGATAVVSTLGGFGSEEQMKRINGEANVVAVNAAKEYAGWFG
uniref:NAD(P)-binding domain-containing protein n=1 Tax=Glycine max TaxID=3847 RepID=A0A0R0ILA7_SOYBN